MSSRQSGDHRPDRVVVHDATVAVSGRLSRERA
jgi:hypothetical protein